MNLPIGFGQVFAAAAAVLATTVGGSPMARAAASLLARYSWPRS